MMRPVMFTTSDGTVVDAWLLTPRGETGEGSGVALVVPIDPGTGVGRVTEAVQGADSDSYTAA